MAKKESWWRGRSMDYIRVLQVRGWRTVATCLLLLILPPKRSTDRVLEETLICKSTSSGSLRLIYILISLVF